MVPAAAPHFLQRTEEARHLIVLGDLVTKVIARTRPGTQTGNFWRENHGLYNRRALHRR